MNPEIFENQLNNCRILTLQNASEDLFMGYCKRLKTEGFSQKEAHPGYAAFQKEDVGCFVIYYPTIRELRIVTEPDSSYFTYADACGKPIVSPQITQVHLEDFGMSYAIRLSDGRFIVIDGGNSYEPDADRLFETLKAGSLTEKPVIAGWIMTHAHSDHFHCIFPFIEKYGEQITVEKFFFNFPAADDTEHYPHMTNRDPRREENTANTVNIPRFLALVEKLGVPVYTPHTGQTYKIGDALCEILASPDDTVHCSQNLNATSLVIRMELAGQIILWGGDAGFEYAKLAERCADRLKADILQIPHHGFGCGSAEAQIAAFDLIDPKVCLLPASDYVSYDLFSAFKEGTRHLMTNLHVQEVIDGEHTRTVTLPYTPKPYAKDQYLQRYQEGQAGAGNKHWFFTDLSTAHKEDFTFTVINVTAHKAQVIIELFFDGAPKVNFIKTEISGNKLTRLCIIDPEQVESETQFFNPNSLKTVGIPENAAMAVRFISDGPIVVSHPDHKAAYHG